MQLKFRFGSDRYLRVDLRSNAEDGCTQEVAEERVRACFESHLAFERLVLGGTHSSVLTFAVLMLYLSKELTFPSGAVVILVALMQVAVAHFRYIGASERATYLVEKCQS